MTTASTRETPPTQRRTRGRSARRALLVCWATAALLVPACSDSGSSDQASQPSSVGQNAELVALVPQSIRDTGVITVAVSNYPPASYQDEQGNLTGWDVELARGIGDVLGLRVEVDMIEFASIIPGLQSGRYTFGMGDVAINTDRMKIVEMVATHEAYSVFMATESSDLKLSSLDDACGLKLALLAGGVEVDAAEQQQPKCAAAGQPPIEIQQYQSQPEVNLALRSGRAQVEAAASDFLAYVLKQSPGQFKLVGRYGPNQLTGIAIAKNADSAKFADVVAQAVRHLIETGRYKEIFDEHNQGLGLLPADKIEVNPTEYVYGG